MTIEPLNIEPLKIGLDALFDLAATGPDKLRRRDCDQKGARRYADLTATVEGSAVTQLQTALQVLGHTVGGDGVLGTATQDALLAEIGQPDFDQARGDTSRLRDAIWEKAVPLARKAGADNEADTQAKDQKDGVSGESSAPVVGNGYPPHFCQADERWADRVLGQKKTMKKAGCAVTCCAMVVAHYAQPQLVLPARPEGYDPTGRRYLDVFLDQNGGYQGDSLVWGAVCAFAAQHGVQLEYKRETGLLDDQRAALEKACDLIEQGIFPLLRVRYAKDHWNAPFNHFVLGLRYDGHNLYYHDPGYQDGDGTKDGLDNTMLTQRKGGYRIVGLDYFVRKEQVV